MTYFGPAKHSKDCACGCGMKVPVRAPNVWQKSDPYWAWQCPNVSCEWFGTEMCNQSGDTVCSKCGRVRVLVGHFTGPGDGNWRTTITGERVMRPHGKNPATPYFAGRGFFGDGHEDYDVFQALRDNPAEGDGRGQV